MEWLCERQLVKLVMPCGSGDIEITLFPFHPQQFRHLPSKSSNYAIPLIDDGTLRGRTDGEQSTRQGERVPINLYGFDRRGRFEFGPRPRGRNQLTGQSVFAGILTIHFYVMVKWSFKMGNQE